MNTPTHENEIPEWLETARNSLGGVENYLVKRVYLMGTAYTGLGAGDFSTAEYSEEKAAPLFTAESGDADAAAALCMIASLILANGNQLSPKLATYASGVLGERGFGKPARRRGKHSLHDNSTRDLLIVRLIEIVRDKQALSATRNDGKKDASDAVPSTQASACSIIAPYFGMSERAVEGVWNKRNRFCIE